MILQKRSVYYYLSVQIHADEIRKSKEEIAAHMNLSVRKVDKIVIDFHISTTEIFCINTRKLPIK